MSASVAQAAGDVGGQNGPSPSSQMPHPSLPPSGHAKATLSASELRTGMQQHFRANGTLQQLKTQLRGMMLTDLLQQPKTARMLVGGAAQSLPTASTRRGTMEDRAMMKKGAEDAAAAPAADAASGGGVRAVPRGGDHTLQSWSCGLADALVENHLRRTRRAMSLSIFSTEAEVPPFTSSGSPSEEESYLAHIFRQTAAGEAGGLLASSPGGEDDLLTPSPSRSIKSVLQRLVEDCVAKHGAPAGTADGARHLHSCSTQTDAADSADGAAGSPLLSLECRLAAVDAQYALTFAQLRRGGAAGEQPFFLRAEVERRLAQYKADMHAQLRSEYEQKYNAFTRTKLQEARDEAEQRSRSLVRSKTEELQEMERSVVVRLEQERERLKLSWEDVHQQRMEMERRQRDGLARVAECEAALQQKDDEMHTLREACRALRLQCAKWEELSATRLMELDNARSREERRVEDIRRLQAEHSAELRLKDEEISRLRFRLRLLTREVEVPANAAPAEGRSSAVSPTQGNAVGSAAAPVDPKQLYGLLLRTEELQRNAVVQQQQQQQRWDAAWVASAAATAAPASGPATASPSPSMSAPAVISITQTTAQGAPAAEMTVTASSVPSTVSADSTHVADATPQPHAANSTTAKGASLGSPTSGTEAISRGDAPPAAAAAAAAVATSQQQLHPTPTSRQASVSTGATKSTATSSSPSSKRSSKSRLSAATSPESRGSQKTSTSTSHSNTPQKIQSASEEKEEAAAAAASSSSSSSSASSTAAKAKIAAQLMEVVQAEETSRAENAEEEDSARAAIVWSEQNKRAIVMETARQRNGHGSDRSSGGSSSGRVVRPWERVGAGSGAAPSATALGGGTIFDDSFSTDDDALIRDTDEDDSEF